MHFWQICSGRLSEMIDLQDAGFSRIILILGTATHGIGDFFWGNEEDTNSMSKRWAVIKHRFTIKRTV